MTTAEPLTTDPTAWLRAEVAELRRAVLALRWTCSTPAGVMRRVSVRGSS